MSQTNLHVRIKFKTMSSNVPGDMKAVTPMRATDGSVGYDLYSTRQVRLSRDNLPTLVPTGLYLEIPFGYAGYIFPRSSMGYKGIRMPNSVGVIDSDYRGELQVMLSADTHSSYNYDDDVVIPAGTRIAQLVILPVVHADFIENDELSSTDRGEGGFGSTGA